MRRFCLSAVKRLIHKYATLYIENQKLRLQLDLFLFVTQPIKLRA